MNLTPDQIEHVEMLCRFHQSESRNEIAKAETAELLKAMRQPKLGRPLKIDWAGVNWDKSNAELSRELSLAGSSLSNWRKKLGKPKVTKWYPACLSWDWGKSDTQICRELGVSIRIVAGYRTLLNKPAAPPDRSAAPRVEMVKYDWEAVDWARPDIELARAIGCTRERVRQKRAELGKPKIYACDAKYNKFAERFKGCTELTSRDRIEAGVAWSTFKLYCAKAGIKWIESPGGFKKSELPWEKLNWAIPTIVLAKIWNLKTTTVSNHRCNNTRPSASFWVKGGRIPSQFQPIVDAEIEKAKSHFATHSPIPTV